MNRLVIYTADIQAITGKSERQARNVLSIIKTINNKQKHQVVTVNELCTHLGLKKEEVEKVLK